MKRNILIIGGSPEQKPLVLKVKEKGFTVHVFDKNTECRCSKIADVFHQISIYEPEQILEIARPLQPQLVLSIATDQGIKTANYISEQLQLPTNGINIANLTTDKHKMKQVMHKHNIPTPVSFLIRTPQDIRLTNLHYPFIIKASDRTGGRGVQLVHNQEEFFKAFHEAKEISFKGKVLAEEYFKGKQYSIETISFNGVHQIAGITEEFYTPPPRFIEVQHLMQARIKPEIRSKINQLITKTLDAFQIKLGACHIELRVNPEGEIKIIELASRMGGDYRNKLMSLSSGDDYVGMLLDVSLGKSPQILNNYKNKFALIKWICEPTDYQTYLKIKEKYPDYLIKEKIEYDGKDFAPSDGTQRKGYYILNFEEKEKLEELLKR